MAYFGYKKTHFDENISGRVQKGTFALYRIYRSSSITETVNKSVPTLPGAGMGGWDNVQTFTFFYFVVPGQY
jgi:hypothetical protein